MDNKEKQEPNDYLVSMFDSENLTYKQYKHLGKCKTGPCDTEVEDEKGMCCAPHIGHIHASNELHILPKKLGRIWYECDVDYTFGKRNSLRLYYSNDGLMFYSTNHLLPSGPIVYWVQ